MGKGKKSPGYPTTDELRARWRNVLGNALQVTEEEAAALVAGRVLTSEFDANLNVARILAFRVGVIAGARQPARLELVGDSEVSAYASERDGALVVEIDAPADQRVRVNVNDGLVAELVVPE